MEIKEMGPKFRPVLENLRLPCPAPLISVLALQGFRGLKYDGALGSDSVL